MRKVIEIIDIICASAFITLLCMSMIFNQTVMKQDYVKEQLKEQNIYSLLTTEIRNEAKNNIKESSFYLSLFDNYLESMINRLITEDIITTQVNYAINQVYNGKEMKVNETALVKDFTEIVKDFLNEYNITFINQNMISELVSIVVSSITKNIDLSSYSEQIQTILTNTETYIEKIYYYSIFGIILSLIIGLIITKHRITYLAIICLLSAIFIYLGSILISQYDISISNSIINTVVTSVKQDVASQIQSKALIPIIPSIGLFFIATLLRHKKTITE